MDRWYLGECPEPHPRPPLAVLNSDTSVYPVTFKSTPSSPGV